MLGLKLNHVSKSGPRLFWAVKYKALSFTDDLSFSFYNKYKRRVAPEAGIKGRDK